MNQIFFSVLGALLPAILVSWWFYLYPKSKHSKPIILFVFRALSIFFLFLLLLNPRYYHNAKSIIKPDINIVIDNSMSIKSANQQNAVLKWLNDFKNSTALNEKYHITYYTIGEQLNLLGDSLKFDETHTDFSSLNSIKSTINGQKSPVILLTDGNQNKGLSVSYLNTENPVFPVVFGDTTSYRDVYISRINNNPYGFLNNTFPVEIFVNYKGTDNAQTNLSISKKSKIIWQQNINFSEGKHSQQILLNLKSDDVGQQFYTAKLSSISDEKNTFNNTSKFSIEIVDQSTKVLILSSITHPDLGALKQAIESNQQRKVDLSIGLTKNINISDYQLVILYQPTSVFKQLINELNTYKKPFWVISGKNTDWQFLNANQTFFTKETTNLDEDYQVAFNPNFSLFQLNDFNLGELPPLKDAFGKIKINTQHETLFFQKVKNSVTDFPLLTFIDEKDQKLALLNGEGLWQWRIYNFKEYETFDQFDNFIDVVVQYLTANDQTDLFKITYKKIINVTDNQQIKVNLFNESIQTDRQANLNFQLFDSNGKSIRSSRMTLNDQSNYSLTLDPLEVGDYTFKVTEQNSQKSKRGYFSILEYDIEKQVVNSDYKQMKLLAVNTNGNLYFANDKSNKIFNNLLNNTEYKNIEKVNKKQQYLIDWRWLLVLLIVSLTIEWLIRKYRGLI